MMWRLSNDATPEDRVYAISVLHRMVTEGTLTEIVRCEHGWIDQHYIPIDLVWCDGAGLDKETT